MTRREEFHARVSKLAEQPAAITAEVEAVEWLLANSVRVDVTGWSDARIVAFLVDGLPE